MEDLIVQLCEALESLDRQRVESVFGEACGRRSAMDVAEQLIAPALERMGEAWSAGRIALSQIYMGSRICEELVMRVLPRTAAERKSRPRQAIVVLADYHFMGKNIILAILRATGFDLVDYGRMEVDELVARVEADGIEILLISVLMLPAALKIRQVRAALDAKGRRVRIAVGGAPFLFDDELWREVGADAMGRNAAEAMAIVQGWMEKPG